MPVIFILLPCFLSSLTLSWSFFSLGRDVQEAGYFWFIRDGCFHGICGPGIFLCAEKTRLRVGVNRCHF